MRVARPLISLARLTTRINACKWFPLNLLKTLLFDARRNRCLIPFRTIYAESCTRLAKATGKGFSTKQSYYFESTAGKYRNATAINTARGDCINDFVRKPQAWPARVETFSTPINRPF